MARRQRVEVVPGDVAEALGQGLERLVLGGLARGVQGGERAPVEAAVGGHDHVAPRRRAAPLAGELDGALVGLGAAVAEEDLPRLGPSPPRGARRARWPPRPRSAWRRGWRRAAASAPARTSASATAGWLWPSDTTAKPRQEVEVATAVGVPQLGAPAAYELHRRSGVRRHQWAERDVSRRVYGLAVLGGHAAASPVTIVPMPSSVKISSSKTWATRPSRMWARRTPPRDGPHARRDLRDHPATKRPVGHERLELGGRRLADERRRVVEITPQALDVGQVHELLGPDRFGEHSCDRVGVDVVRLASEIGADRGHHRDEVLVQQALEDGRVHVAHVADEAQLRLAGRGPQQPGILAADAHRDRREHVDGRHDRGIDLTAQHHPRDVDGLRVGHPQPVAELGHLAEATHQRR